MRINERETKASLSNADVFLLASESDSVWRDYKITWSLLVEQMSEALPEIPLTNQILMSVNSGVTISSAIETGNAYINTHYNGVVISITGMVCGTISADGTTVTITVKLDGTTAIMFSQICTAGANIIPVNCAVEVSTSGNHVISIECSASNGTFTI